MEKLTPQNLAAEYASQVTTQSYAKVAPIAGVQILPLHLLTDDGGSFAELVRFDYIEARARRGATGLYTGLVVRITEKVLPCFRKLPWLAGWLAQNFPDNGGNPDRTELSYINHPHKEPSSKTAPPPW